MEVIVLLIIITIISNTSSCCYCHQTYHLYFRNKYGGVIIRPSKTEDDFRTIKAVAWLFFKNSQVNTKSHSLPMPLHTKHTPLPWVSSAIYHSVKTSLRVVVLTGRYCKDKGGFLTCNCKACPPPLRIPSYKTTSIVLFSLIVVVVFFNFPPYPSPFMHITFKA